MERSSSGNATVSEEELDSKLLCADSPDVAGGSGTKTNRGRHQSKKPGERIQRPNAAKTGCH